MGLKQNKKLKLYPYQQEALEKVLREPSFALFMEPGTGKTPIAIKAIEERYKRGEINRVIIYAPNTLLYNWQLEIEKFLGIPQSDYVVETLNYPKKKRDVAYNDFTQNDLELLNLSQLKALGYKGKKKDIVKNNKKKLLILIINYEKARVMFKQLNQYKPHMLIVDESHKVRNQNQQSKGIYKSTRATKYRILMTGTPICNGYEDLFMQYKIMDESIFGTSYKSFEEQYIVKGGYMGYDIVGYNNEEELLQVVDETSFKKRLADCVDLPKLLYKNHFCELNNKAQKIYNDMNKDMIAQVDSISEEIPRKKLKQICKEYGVSYKPNESYNSLFMKAIHFIGTASCELIVTKLMRLQQISGGFLTLDDGTVKPISQDKLNVVKEIVQDATNPIIIFCQYVPEILTLTEQLSKIKRKKKPIVVKHYRDKKDRDKIYRDFQEGKIDVLILQLSSGSVGLNLQVADKIIFYSWNFSSDDYVQAVGRIKRNGQKKPMEVNHIIAKDTIDMNILEAVKQKRKLANKLLD